MGLRVLHTADIHLAPRLAYLEDAIARRQRRDEITTHVDDLPKYVRDYKVDVVLLAGDIFDRDLAALPEVGRLKNALEACNGVPVLITPGTHDPWRKGGIWDQKWPSNVVVFKSNLWEAYEIAGSAFYGIATTGIAKAGGLFNGIEYVEGAQFHIGIAHASMLWEDLIDKVDPKNFPFTEQEIDGTSLNYLALGDHHNSRVVVRGKRMIAYPGSPEGLSLDPAESGPRHMLIAEFEDPEQPPRIEKILCNKREIYLEKISVDEFDNSPQEDVLEEIRRKIMKASGSNVLARFDVSGVLPYVIDVDEAMEDLRNEYFILDIRDKVQMLSEIPSGIYTIRALFERKIAEVIESTQDEKEKEVAKRALHLGLQALEGILP